MAVADPSESAKPLIRKLRGYGALSAAEQRALADAMSVEREFQEGEDIVVDGSEPKNSTLMLSGYSARYKMLPSGSRQITAVHISGDFVDLHSFLLKKMDHGIVALTRCKVALVPHPALQDITDRFPHLTRLLWLSTLVDGARHREWLVAMGRQSARDRVAHFLCELFVRLSWVGATDGMKFRLPITQVELGDALGLSYVHANRVLQELRSLNLFTWQRDEITIVDWNRLRGLADFDPTYLHIGESEDH